MPVGKVWNIEWLNQNAQRNYPFSEVATVKDVTGSVRLPDDFIVDLLWPVHAGIVSDPGLIYIGSVDIFSSGATIGLYYNDELIGTAALDASSFTENSSYSIFGAGNFEDSIGKITIGNLESAQRFAGSYIFDLNGGRLEETVVRPDLRGVTALYAVSGNATSQALYGDINLVSGANIRLVPDIETNSIIVNAIEGEGLSEPCDCLGDTEDLPCITTINGQGPNENGDFTISGDDCLTPSSVANGIAISDDCSKPCCGCEELKVLVDTLKNINREIMSVREFAAQLSSRISEIESNLIASRLTDIACETP